MTLMLICHSISIMVCSCQCCVAVGLSYGKLAHCYNSVASCLNVPTMWFWIISMPGPNNLPFSSRQDPTSLAIWEGPDRCKVPVVICKLQVPNLERTTFWKQVSIQVVYCLTARHINFSYVVWKRAVIVWSIGLSTFWIQFSFMNGTYNLDHPFFIWYLAHSVGLCLERAVQGKKGPSISILQGPSPSFFSGGLLEDYFPLTHVTVTFLGKGRTGIFHGLNMTGKLVLHSWPGWGVHCLKSDDYQSQVESLPPNKIEISGDGRNERSGCPL